LLLLPLLDTENSNHLQFSSPELYNFNNRNLVRLKSAEAIHNTGGFKKSNDRLRRILKTRQAETDTSLKARILDLIGENWYKMGDLRQAEQLHQTSLQLAQQIGDKARQASALKNLCRVYFRYEDYQQAESHIFAAIPLARASGDSLVLAHCLRNLGVIFWLRGYFEPAMNDGYLPALEIYQSIKYRFGEAITLNNIGLVYYNQQDYYTNLEYQKQALTIQQGIGDRAGQVDSYYYIASTHYRLGEGKQAIRLFKKAYQIAKEIDYYWIQEAVALHSYKPLGEKIAENYNKKRNDLQGQKNLAEQRVNAAIDSREGNYQRALVVLKRLLPTYQSQHDLKNLAGCHLVIGQSYLGLNQLDSAKAHFQCCQAIADSSGMHWWQFTTRYGLGQVAEKKKDWKIALVTYQDAVKYLEQIYDKVYDQDFQSSWTGRKIDGDLAIVRMLIRLGDESKNRNKYLSQAFYNWQEATARYFNNLFARHRNLATAAKHQREMTELQKLLPQNSAYLGYVVDERQIFIFVITKKIFDVLEVPIEHKHLEGKAKLARELLEQLNYSDESISNTSWSRVLKSLFNALILPIQQAGYLENIDHLLILPNRVLHYLPFACLVGNDILPDDSQLKKGSPYLDAGDYFLIEKYTITYLPAASSLLFYAQNESHFDTSEERSLLLFAPLTDHFKGTKKEAQAIAATFKGSVSAFIDNNATVTAFKNVGEKYKFIHFASHSHLEMYSPESTYVELKSDDHQDGFLTVPEILDLKLNADLIVLSSCQSGLGTSRFANPDFPINYHPTDEFMSLPRAFCIAGARQVVSTFWPVQDLPSAEFMTHFYKNLENLSPTAALVKTQRDFLYNKNISSGTLLSHPYVWGAYMVVGMP